MPLKEQQVVRAQAVMGGTRHKDSGKLKYILTQKAEHRVSAKHNWREGKNNNEYDDNMEENTLKTSPFLANLKSSPHCSNQIL